MARVRRRCLRRVIRSAAPCAAWLALVVGCWTSPERQPEPVTPAPPVLAVSHDAEELAGRWRRSILDAGGADVAIHVTGEALAINAVIEGRAQAALVHRRATEAEVRYAAGVDLVPRPELRYLTLARAPVGLLVHASNPVDAMDLSDLRRLLLGSLREWDAVGGPAGEVVLYGREPDTATAALLRERILGGADPSPLHGALPSDAAVARAVASDPLGLGVGGSPFGEAVRELSLRDGGELLMPRGASASGREWPMIRDLLFVTQGEPDPRSLAFADFALSRAGRAIAEQSWALPGDPGEPGGP